MLKGLLDRVRSGLTEVAEAIQSGRLRVDNNLHVSALVAEGEDPKIKDLRAALSHQIGEIQLPELILTVDSRVRFSWLMLGREPHSTEELLMIYAGIDGVDLCLNALTVAAGVFLFFVILMEHRKRGRRFGNRVVLGVQRFRPEEIARCR